MGRISLEIRPIKASYDLHRPKTSTAEMFAPYCSEHECSLLGQMRSDWSRLGQDRSGPFPPPAELEQIDQIIPGRDIRMPLQETGPTPVSFETTF